jgi:hypothetical protein
MTQSPNNFDLRVKKNTSPPCQIKRGLVLWRYRTSVRYWSEFSLPKLHLFSNENHVTLEGTSEDRTKRSYLPPRNGW